MARKMRIHPEPIILTQVHLPEPLYEQLMATKPEGCSRNAYFTALLKHGHAHALATLLQDAELVAHAPSGKRLGATEVAS